MRKLSEGVAGAAMTLCLCAVPELASADTYAFEWSYRWSVGSIAHTTDLVDSDPSPFRAVYVDSILDYRFDSFNLETSGFARFSGSGGTMIVDENLHCGVSSGCASRTFTFQMGAGLDPVTLVATTETVYYDEPDVSHPPDWPLDGPWAAPLNGTIHSDRAPNLVGAMNPYSSTRHSLVALPVPEPAGAALLALGLGLVAIRGRRRSQVSTVG